MMSFAVFKGALPVSVSVISTRVMFSKLSFLSVSFAKAGEMEKRVMAAVAKSTKLSFLWFMIASSQMVITTIRAMAMIRAASDSVVSMALNEESL